MMTFEAFKLDRVFPDPENQPEVVTPVTASEVSVPTDVMLVWADWSWVGARAPNATFEALIFERTFPPPETMAPVKLTLPVTVRFVVKVFAVVIELLMYAFPATVKFELIPVDVPIPTFEF